MNSLRTKIFLLVSLFIIFTACSLVYADYTFTYKGHDGNFSHNVDAQKGHPCTFNIVKEPNLSGNMHFRWTSKNPETGVVWEGGGKDQPIILYPFKVTPPGGYTLNAEMWIEGEGGGGSPDTLHGTGQILQPTITVTDPMEDKYVALGASTPVPIKATVKTTQDWVGEPVELSAIGPKTYSTSEPHPTTDNAGIASHSFSPGTSWDTGEYTTWAKMINSPTIKDSGKKIVVVEVESLLPAGGQEIDDGDDDDNTKVFIFQIAASGSITVTATPNPEVTEANLPTGWTLTGGTGSGKLTRTISKTTPSKTVLTCTCGTSEKQTTVYVVRCRFWAFSDTDGLGHAWWRFYLLPTSANVLLDDEYQSWVNTDAGYFSSTGGDYSPGEVRKDQGDHVADACNYWDISFNNLSAGVAYTYNLSESPGYYYLLTNNCVHKTKAAGAAAGVTITCGWTPESLADFLNSQ